MRPLRPALATVLAALPALVALAGCETTPSASGGSCSADAGLCLNLIAVDENLVALAVCQEVVGPGYAFYPDQYCPVDGLAGVCTRSEPGLTFSVVYAAPTYTTATASADCEARGGAFQPP